MGREGEVGEVSVRRIVYAAEALVEVNMHAYVLATVILGAVVFGLTFMNTARVGLGDLINPLWGLEALNTFYDADRNSSSGVLVALTMLPALIALTCMGAKSKTLIIVNAPLSRADVLAASYLIALTLTAGIAAYTATYWGVVKYLLLICRNVDPLTFALGATAIVTAFTLPTMLEGVAISSLIAARMKYGMFEAFAVFIALLVTLPVVWGLCSWVGSEVLHITAVTEYVMAAIVPGEGFARLVAVALGVPGAAINGVNYSIVAAISSASLATLTLVGVTSFIRSAEVREA